MEKSSVKTVVNGLQCLFINSHILFFDNFLTVFKIVYFVFLETIVMIGGLSTLYVPLPLLFSPLFLGNFFLFLYFLPKYTFHQFQFSHQFLDFHDFSVMNLE